MCIRDRNITLLNVDEDSISHHMCENRLAKILQIARPNIFLLMPNIQKLCFQPPEQDKHCSVTNIEFI